MAQPSWIPTLTLAVVATLTLYFLTRKVDDDDDGVDDTNMRLAALIERYGSLEEHTRQLEHQMEENMWTLQRRGHSSSTVEETVVRMTSQWMLIQRSNEFRELEKFEPRVTQRAQQQIETTMQLVERYLLHMREAQPQPLSEAREVKRQVENCLHSYNSLIETIGRKVPKIRWSQDVTEKEAGLRRWTNKLEACLIAASEDAAQDKSAQNAEVKDAEEGKEMKDSFTVV
ncbi:expressed unknown protein [Seminavis robusta]|uniref:Uncharacterized protein n=1 Tax=Seminavis robusta TaxID=568900 RepID=A0A9N8END0_9STRA|nr:expressed unknown protein [Seminavis robusta]|eukprot:Sro1422_g271310.1 n/a (229) ;mRNA; f:14020-14706